MLGGIQKKLANYLDRLEKPDYLYSATKGRSHLVNALAHMGAKRMIKVDIKAFYQNASISQVRKFYENDLKCSPDIAFILAKLSTFNGFLPTGSPLSPILSFFAYKRLFDHINALSVSENANMTLYVDDIAISGNSVAPELARKVCSILQKHGLKGHKLSYFNEGEIKVITGIAVGESSISIPYKRHKKIRVMESAFHSSESLEVVSAVGKALVGQYREASTIEPSLKSRVGSIEARVSRVRNKAITAVLAEVKS